MPRAPMDGTLRSDGSTNGNEELAPPPLLFCLAGKPAPLGMAQAVSKMAGLAVEGRAALEEILLACLEPMPEDQLDSRITRLCRRVSIDAEVIGPGLKGIVFLMRQAAAADADPNAFGADIMALSSRRDLAKQLAGVYAKALRPLRTEIARATLLAHGKVLSGMEWRIDTLGSSNRGRKINMPVAMLTLHYQDGAKSEHISLQVVPEMLAELREVCNELLNG